MCDLIKKISTKVEVVIWQHPSEEGKAKGTARLLHLCLPNSRIICGETHTAESLGLIANRCALLYPETEIHKAELNGSAPIQQLLLLDGTWRKSRKMLYLNPWLNSLPRLAIAASNSSYRIRKAEQSQQLSTFEAAALGLAKLENNSELAMLDSVFENFMAHYESFIGK